MKIRERRGGTENGMKHSAWFEITTNNIKGHDSGDDSSPAYNWSLFVLNLSID